MKTIEELRKLKAQQIADAEAIIKPAQAEKRGMSTDETSRFDALMDGADATQKEIDALENSAADDSRASRLESEKAKLSQSQGRSVKPGAIAPAGTAPSARVESRKEKRDSVLATARVSGNLRNFPNDKEGRYSAYRFGMWCIAGISTVFGGGSRARMFCKENGLFHLSDRDEERAAIGHVENINYSGGYLVPDEFNNMLIVLREKFGVFRQFAKIIPMKGDTSSRPRRTGGLTATFVGEGAAGTASTKSWDLVSLQAKKLMALALYSSEMNEDAVINIGDDLAGEIAYAFAKKEDDCGFNGDGTSTYGGIIGLTSSFSKQGSSANQSGTVAGSGSGWSGLVLSDFNNVISRLPEYADTPNVAWYCHRTFWASVMQKLQYAAGGNKVADISGGVVKEFLGYPVKTSQILPKTSASAQYPLFFGDLALAVDFGNRRETQIAFSNSATIGSTNAFAQDALAIRGTERFDINCHDVGNWSATAALRQAGPVVTLITG